MSLLDSGPEDVIVYMEEAVTDADGNTVTRASATGTPTKARIQFQGQSGTSSRRAEQDEEGFQTERVYTVRFPRDFPVVGAQAKMEWAGEMYSIFGDVQRFANSRRTRHNTYVIRRS